MSLKTHCFTVVIYNRRLQVTAEKAFTGARIKHIVSVVTYRITTVIYGCKLKAQKYDLNILRLLLLIVLQL